MSTDLLIKIVDDIPEDYLQFPRIYADASYFNFYLPEEVKFTSVVLTNKVKLRRTLIRVYFELCHFDEMGNMSYPVPLDINFPQDAYYGKKVDIGSSFVFTVLREHLTASIRSHYPTKGAKIRVACEMLGGKIPFSEPVDFDLTYPYSPLQDIELLNYNHILKQQRENFFNEYNRINQEYKSLYEYADLHKKLGIQLTTRGDEKFWTCREYAPDAREIYFIYDWNGYGDWGSFVYNREENGFWSVEIPYETFYHGMFYEIHLYGKYSDEKQIRVPALANWVEQNEQDPNQWCARFWHPEHKYIFKHSKPQHENPIIYEAHVGMAKNNCDKSTETSRGFGSYRHFIDVLLPYIKEAGYNTIQLMGIPEHPLYKSFGYQVSSYFAPSHRYGTLNEFKELVDTAHKLDIAILLDIVHSHSCSNIGQGLNKYDTGAFLFEETRLTQWGTSLFDYEKEITRRFLLSNCRYWLEEFNIDGFRFDAVGSIIFIDEGFKDNFSHVNSCFYTADGTMRRKMAGVLYIQLANTLIHEHSKYAFTIAEESSGSPDITGKPENAGLGFDYRFTMGIPDFWDKYIKEPQEIWKTWYECSHHRLYEQTISYTECHDQCINGDDVLIWRMIGNDMYDKMSWLNGNWNTSRGVALSKLIKLFTFSTSHKGYMDFMGNEFSHPEWLDADASPYRQWDLAKNDLLHYKGLQAFNRDMLKKFGSSEFFNSPLRCRAINEEARFIIFERGSYLFAFNFNELESANIRASVTLGKYSEVFSTDETFYAGHNNLSTTSHVEHFTLAGTGDYEQDIELYIPVIPFNQI